MSIQPITSNTRTLRDFDRLAAERFDTLIIGGGINGAGLARDLALRGLKVALVEKGDFASGTSSASTKLVHGGLRYLETFAFHLVFEACRERRTLQNIAPHLVRPLPFFIPVYRDDPRALLTIRAGLTLYDLLALFRNTHRHEILSAAEALRQEPVLQESGLVGVARYWDCRMDDARLCLENILAAVEAGAVMLNYAEAVGLITREGRTCGARVRDGESGREVAVEAEVVVNAAGPWLDRVCALDGDRQTKLRPTRGTHILVPRISRGEEALYLSSKRDARLFFVIPWGGYSMIGTTDVDFSDDPDTVRPTEEDIAYLLAEAGRHLRDYHLERKDVLAAFSGLRPLVAEEAVGASRVSREHRIFTSASGLVSIGGGKYTTYRSVAEQVADLVVRRLGRGARTCLTARQPLPGGDTGDFTLYVRERLPALCGRCGLSPRQLDGLLNLYGSRTEQVLELARQEPELLEPVVPGSDLLAVQVAYAADFELARTPEDVLRRRTPLAIGAGRGLAEVEAVAQLLARRLQVPQPQYQAWVSAYRDRYSRI